MKSQDSSTHMWRLLPIEGSWIGKSLLIEFWWHNVHNQMCFAEFNFIFLLIAAPYCTSESHIDSETRWLENEEYGPLLLARTYEKFNLIILKGRNHLSYQNYFNSWCLVASTLFQLFKFIIITPSLSKKEKQKKGSPYLLCNSIFVYKLSFL